MWWRNFKTSSVFLHQQPFSTNNIMTSILKLNFNGVRSETQYSLGSPPAALPDERMPSLVAEAAANWRCVGPKPM